jgi:hypothetical protein
VQALAAFLACQFSSDCNKQLQSFYQANCFRSSYFPFLSLLIFLLVTFSRGHYFCCPMMQGGASTNNVKAADVTFELVMLGQVVLLFCLPSRELYQQKKKPRTD